MRLAVSGKAYVVIFEAFTVVLRGSRIRYGLYSSIFNCRSHRSLKR